MHDEFSENSLNSRGFSPATLVNPLLGNDPVDEALLERIREARARLGRRVLILGHHYQRDEVIQFADQSGDSLDLALHASRAREAEAIVFCGVHFMAETADILSEPRQVVILPDFRAGCSLADMAEISQVEECWEELAPLVSAKLLPVAYINSAVDLKAFVGRHDGAVCTSSNAPMVLRWGFERAEKILFFPDQNLGRNTAVRMGIPLDEMVVYDPHEPGGGNPPEAYRRARVILWRGHCSVHQNFQPSDPPFWRKKVPGIQIICHPECRYEVVQQADFVGSTKYIIQTVGDSAPGTQWAIGTEHHMVNRLRLRHPDRFIASLSPFACQCSTMFRITPEALCQVLEDLLDDRVVSDARRKPETERWWRIVKVDDDTSRWARITLDRMLSLR
jgi:quinolinate synthase